MDQVVHLHQAVALLGRFPALTGADLDVARGEIVLVRGPNGAGKTTLLRLCAGLLSVAAGDAFVLGHDLRHDRHAVRAKVGLLGHANGLYDDLTVAENVRFWGRTAKASAAEVDAALALLGLDGRLAELPVARLSAGQRRRTALAVLVARRAELWLLDEPHAGLDAAGRGLIDGVIRQAAAAGVTILVASHELDGDDPLGHRTITVVGGRVVADESGVDVVHAEEALDAVGEPTAIEPVVALPC